MKTLRLAILSPDPNDPVYTQRIAPPAEGFVALFARLGVEAFAHPWTLGPPPDADAALASLVWGYHFKLEAFKGLLASWPASLPLFNPPDVLLWNATKTYLAELGDKGVSIIPTLTPARTDAATLEDAFARFDAEALIVKPLVSAGSHQTLRIARGANLTEALVGSPPEGRMIQPFLPAVADEGELSVFVFGGRPSHAVRKRARGGDFRVQPQFGAEIEAMEPDAEVLALARAALDAAPPGVVYARIDMVRDAAGVLRLMELEAIEPDLYFAFAPDRGEAFGRAVLERLGRAP